MLCIANKSLNTYFPYPMSEAIYVALCQNHNYAVDPASLPAGVEVTHINLNDGSCAGLAFPSLNIMSLQYHPEASPGPHDSDPGNVITIWLRRMIGSQMLACMSVCIHTCTQEVQTYDKLVVYRVHLTLQLMHLDIILALDVVYTHKNRCTG